MTKLKSEVLDFKKALARFGEVLEKPKDDIVRDSSIQRFEFCMDLAWKTMKTYLEEKKDVIVNSPRQKSRRARL